VMRLRLLDKRIPVVLLGRMLMSGFQETVRAELDRDIELVRATQLQETASDSQVGSRLL
jgi:hypothetical protein